MFELLGHLDLLLGITDLSVEWMQSRGLRLCLVCSNWMEAQSSRIFEVRFRYLDVHSSIEGVETKLWMHQSSILTWREDLQIIRSRSFRQWGGLCFDFEDTSLSKSEVASKGSLAFGGFVISKFWRATLTTVILGLSEPMTALKTGRLLVLSKHGQSPRFFNRWHYSQVGCTA